MYDFLKNKVLLGIILYLVPFSCSFLIFRFFSWLIDPVRSLEHAVYAFSAYIALLLMSFIGSYLMARQGKRHGWGVRFFFALIAVFQFLPLIIVAVLGAGLIYVNSKFGSKYSKFGPLVTSIIAAMVAFAFMLFIFESGDTKTARSKDKAVYALNHLSSGDYFASAIMALFLNWRVMIGANLWDIKLFHWFFNAVGIPIERERSREAALQREEAILESQDFLRHNKQAIVQVYAQSTREREPETKGVVGFKLGAFRIACEDGYDVIPVTINFTNKWRKPWKQNKTTKRGVKVNYIKKFFQLMYQFFKTGINPTIVRITIGSPVSSVGKTPEDLKLEVQEIIDATYKHNSLPKKERKKIKKQKELMNF